MLVSLAAETLGEPRAEPVVGLGSPLGLVSLGLFTLNVLRNATNDTLGKLDFRCLFA